MLHIDVAIGILEINGGVLFVRRAKHPYQGFLLLPGGKCEKGESFDEAIDREILEETGLTVIEKTPVGYVEDTTITFHVPPYSHTAVYYRLKVSHADYRAGDEDLVLVPFDELFHHEREMAPTNALILKDVYQNNAQSAYRTEVHEKEADIYVFISCQRISFPSDVCNEIPLSA